MNPQADVERLSLHPPSRVKYFFKFHWRGVVLFLTPIILLPIFFLPPEKAMRTCYMLCVMGVFWVTEVLPLGITALIPIFYLPLMDVMDSKEICLCYCKDALILFLGSLIVAIAIEASNLHIRVALYMISVIGCSPRRLHFSLMMLTMFVSMWISNSAAAAMMCPIIKAIVQEMETQGMLELTDSDKPADEQPYPSREAIAFYLGVAYAASIGGLGTLIGTGTNIAFKGLYDGRFPNAGDMEFMPFSCFTIPMMLIITLVTYFILNWQFLGLFRPNSAVGKRVNVSKEGAAVAKAVIVEKRNELGKFTCREVQVSIFFFLLVGLFLTRKPGFFTGYANVLNERKIGSSWPMLFCTMFFFSLPVDYLFLKYCCFRKPDPEGPRESLLEWNEVSLKISWNLFLLLGGGFALSDAVSKSGFAKLAGDNLKSLNNLPPFIMQLICIIIGIIATAFTSNVAMCNILVTVLLEMTVAIKVHPAYLALPTCLALSCAFHFPVSTPPNATVAAFGNIRTKDMALGGIGPSLVSILVISLITQIWGPVIFPNITSFPAWAQ